MSTPTKEELEAYSKAYGQNIDSSVEGNPAMVAGLAAAFAVHDAVKDAELDEMRGRVAYAAAIVSGDARWDKQEELERVTAERNNLRSAWDEMEPEYAVRVMGVETPVDPNTEEQARKVAEHQASYTPSVFPPEPVRRYSTYWDYI